MQHKDLIIKALRASRGDEYERTNRSFSWRSEHQMNEPYGSSGLTHRQVLHAAFQRAHEHDEAIAWVEAQP